MKRVILEAFLPEMKGPNINKVARGEASNAKAAISRAFGDLFKQVKGKRISTIKATLSIITVEPEAL